MTKRCVLCWKPVEENSISMGNSLWHQECWKELENDNENKDEALQSPR